MFIFLHLYMYSGVNKKIINGFIPYSSPYIAHPILYSIRIFRDIYENKFILIIFSFKNSEQNTNAIPQIKLNI